MMAASTSSAPKFAVGDLVWAKMKGFCPWPGKLVDPATSSLRKPPGHVQNKNSYCVYFFGSNNFAWITEDAIKPYAEFKEQNIKLSKSKAFKEAVAVIEDYIKKGCVDELPGDAGDASPAPSDSNNDGKSSSSLPSIDDDIATITTTLADGKSSSSSADSSPSKSNSNSSTPLTSSGQRDYSRKPFTKPKRVAANSSSNNGEPAEAPSAKRSRASSTASTPASSSFSSSSEETPDATSSSSSSKANAAKTSVRNILARTSHYLLESNSGNNSANELDVSGNVSAKSKTIRASSLRFGFIGLGVMGQRLLKNLINSGHTVTIWNRTPSKCKDFVKAGATKATTPADVVAASDITFSCLADPHAVKEIVFGNCGVLAEIRSGKGYVEMTTIDSETSNDVSEAIIARGGRFIEAPVITSGKQQAEEGNLTVIASGDKSLFDDCHSCFQAISEHAFYLGSQVGDASKMSLVVSMLIGNVIGCLSESMALADRTGLSQKDLLEVLSLSPLNCPTIISKGRAMIDGGFPT